MTTSGYRGFHKVVRLYRRCAGGRRQLAAGALRIQRQWTLLELRFRGLKSIDKREETSYTNHAGSSKKLESTFIEAETKAEC